MVVQVPMIVAMPIKLLSGVGKTELLSVFAVLLNTAKGEIPDIFKELREMIQNRFPKQFDLPARFRVVDIKQQIAQLCELEEVVPQPPAPAAAPNQAPAPAPQSIPNWKTLAPLLQNKSKELLKRYSHINLTPLLKQLDDKTELQLDTKESVLALAYELIDIRFIDLCYRRLMHQRFAPSKWKEFFHDEAFKRAKSLPSLQFVIFIDECNTGTDSMGLLKEVFVDGTLDGDKNAIPSNVFFVAAENPYIEEKGSYTNYNGIEPSKKPFIVRKTNFSLKHITVNFGGFTPDHEESFLEVYFAMQIGSQGLQATELQLQELKDLIILSQKFLRNAHEGSGTSSFQHLPNCLHAENNRCEQVRIHASIRDIMRAITLYKAFRSDKLSPIITQKSSRTNENRM